MTKTELVFIPTPGMGHLLSTVELAKLIVQTNDTISILFLVYHIPIYESTKIQAYIESQTHIVNPNRITFMTLPPLSNPPDPSSPDFYTSVVEAQKPLVEQALASRQPKPAAFVLDLMNVSIIDVANDMQVPSYIYFTAGANLLNSMFHFQALADGQGMKDITELVADPDVEFHLPGFRNRVPVEILPWVYRDKESVWPSLILHLARRFREAKGIVLNTFLELENFAIQALLKQDKVPTVYFVGPLLALEGRGDSKPSDNNSPHNKDEDDIMGWLDKQPPSSVVFLCFGSMGYFDSEQVEEMAHGLDHSGHRFLWSLRKPKQVGSTFKSSSENEIFYEALPEGFLDRTAHRGKIIAWAPQVSILAHPAVGGFVSHCGWNSTLESVWFGVPVATWPVYSEQQLNAFTLVKELGLAVEITLDFRWDFREQTRNVLVTADEVENGIKKLMSIDDEMTKKVREMGDISKKVFLTDGGSSHHFLTRFIEEIAQNDTLS